MKMFFKVFGGTVEACRIVACNIAVNDC